MTKQPPPEGAWLANQEGDTPAVYPTEPGPTQVFPSVNQGLIQLAAGGVMTLGSIL